ncbi:Epidermal growth factor receptor kinase substrate 8-like protein 1 [Merluccius polli]|uniref:Epidermal growth factor receptor kinase substrate 8-like protein 1 n=1 Tax=Merluccius polli TaxID=89951 RepID=A0AA47N3N1_MERPO|nr:Epidermal growth factor receptor kinase substrate 8-like protein 1 [Merluccius polli]
MPWHLTVNCWQPNAINGERCRGISTCHRKCHCELPMPQFELAVSPLATEQTQRRWVRAEVLRGRKPSGVRVMILPGEQLPAEGLQYTMAYSLVNSGAVKPQSSSVNPHREVEILNHCFDDVECFMGRLQQTADAQGILNQRRKQKKRSKKSKKENQDEDLLTMKAFPPVEEDFVGVFQKIKYSFSLLDRLKSLIAEPDSPELLHHVFVPLDLLVKTTGGPELGASVVSPALTSGAVSLLQEHLTQEEKGLWTALGHNWTSPCSKLGVSVPSYTPVFLDGWEPGAPDDQPWEDPVEVQHRQDASRARRAMKDPASPTSERPSSGAQQSDELDGGTLPSEGNRMYKCSYDFVARNSSELSVLQGETLEVRMRWYVVAFRTIRFPSSLPQKTHFSCKNMCTSTVTPPKLKPKPHLCPDFVQVVESSKRWWKCRNRFDQIGFVPFNILEPLSALSNHPENNSVARTKSKKVPLAPINFSYAPPSSSTTSPTTWPQSSSGPPSAMPGDDGGRGFMVNDELLQRLAIGQSGSVRPLVIPRTIDTCTPVDYHSTPQEVEIWLSAKGFSQETVQCLGVLSGAQLFSLNKDELRTVLPQEGTRVYSQVMVQKALLEVPYSYVCEYYRDNWRLQ